MKTKRWLCALLCVLLCIGLLPVTALAAEGAPGSLYVAGQQITDEGYYTQSGGNWTKSGDASTPPSAPYFHYTKGNDNTPATLTLSGVTIQGGTSTGSVPYGAGIYAQCNSGESVSLTIELIGENTITGYYGIYVNAEISADSYGTDASLTITGESNGSLKVSGSYHGIYVKSGTGGASLNINDASVVASSSSSYSGYAGVCVQSSANATGSPNISLSVDGGSLTASGGTSGDGIQFVVGSSQATGATTSLTVTNNAIVDARNGGISASRILETLPTPTPTGNNSSGIIWNGSKGTVYGSVTLQEDLTIGAGESLTLAENASLNAGGCSVIVDGGTVDESIKNALGGSVKYPPTIQTASLLDGTVGTAYSQTLAADGSAPIAWSVSGGSLPEGLTLSNDGTISGTPTAAGTYTFDVEAKNDYGSATGELTIEIKAAPTGSVSVSVTPDAIRLPSVTEGYEPQEPKYITIKNTGDQTIQLKERGKDPWLIITLDKTTLKPDEEATVTVRLKDGLSAETRSTLKTFLSYTGEDGTKGQAHFSITYEIKHDMDRIDAKEPTHLEDGNIECWYCAYCQKYYKGAAGANELSLEEIIIPKLKDHTADGTGWHSDETNHWNTCACGEKLNTAAHTFAWITDKEATATENGSKHEECTVCGYALQAVEIPATGTATPAPTTTPAPTATAAPTATPAPTAEPGLGPKTGDPGVSALWFAAPAVSGLGLAAACRRRRRGTR